METQTTQNKKTSVYEKMSWFDHIKYIFSQKFRAEIAAKEAARLDNIERERKEAELKQLNERMNVRQENIKDFNEDANKQARYLSFQSVSKTFHATPLPVLINADINGLGTAEFVVAKAKPWITPQSEVITYAEVEKMSYAEALEKYIIPVDEEFSHGRHTIRDYARCKITEAAKNGEEGQAALDNALQFCSTMHVRDPKKMSQLDDYVRDLIHNGANPLKPMRDNPNSNTFCACLKRGRFHAALDMLSSPDFADNIDADQANNYLKQIENVMKSADKAGDRTDAAVFGGEFLAFTLGDHDWTKTKADDDHFKFQRAGKDGSYITIYASSKFDASEDNRKTWTKMFSDGRNRIIGIKTDNMLQYMRQVDALERGDN